MLVDVYKITYNAENGRVLEFDRKNDIISVKSDKQIRNMNGAEGIVADGYFVCGDLKEGDVVKFGSKFYEIIDVSVGMSNIKRCYYKAYGG